MTYDLILEERSRLHRLEWFRVCIAGAMVVVLSLDGAFILVWHFPSMMVLIPYLIINSCLSVALFLCTKAIVIRRRLYYGLLQQKYEDSRR